MQGLDAVLGLSAVYSCIRYISDAVASLPINVYRRGPDGQSVRLSSSQFLDSPSVTANPYEWVFQGQASALAYGNAMGLITSRTGVTGPDGLGYPASVEWLPYDRVSIQDDEKQPYNQLRTRIYFDGTLMRREELVHLRAFTVPGRTEAISPIRAFATLIQQGIDALKYSGTWFANGGFPLGTFENTEEEVDVQSAREIRQNLTDTLRAHQPLVYGRNWKYTAITVPPNEAAFIQAMQLNATQVASIYGMPPSKVGGSRGDSLTYATEEQEQLSIITDTLRPWLRRWEVMLGLLLPSTQFVRFDTDALLKTDLKTRYEIFGQQRSIGIRTADELRQQDDLPPLPHGVGNDGIPLGILQGMASRTRAIPNSILSQITLEQDLAAKLLLSLQQKGLVNDSGPPPGDTGAPPVGQTAGQYLGGQLTRGLDAPAEPAPAFAPPHIRCSAAERARAVTWIGMALRAGCLAPEEAEYRTVKAEGALKRGMLAELTSDLPPEDELRREMLRQQQPEPYETAPQGTFAPLAEVRLRERARRWEAEPSPNGTRP